MVIQVDRLDLEIIRLIQKDGRVSVTELAKKLRSSRATVTNRLNRLINEELIMVKGGLNLLKLGFKMASVGLEVKQEPARKEVESHLMNCPRVLNLFRIPEKANIHVTVWGEDEHTINSTIESFRDFPNVEIVHTHYLGTPIHGDVIIKVPSENNAKTPCGMKCADCYRYNKKWCPGCPSSNNYRNPLLK